MEILILSGGSSPRGKRSKGHFFSFLTTYPSPKTTLTLPSHLGKNVSWGGTGGQFPAKP